MLDLYMLETCPYCQKVIKVLDELKFEYNKFDTSNEDNVLRLMTVGGKDQVPFLYDSVSDKKMYESDDIISYLKSLKGSENV